MLGDFRLRVFLTVAKAGSFTEAAAVLNISQPAVSQHISVLERETGVKLFERLHGEIRLTEPGRIFQVLAEEILDSYSTASALFSPFDPETVRVRLRMSYTYIYIRLWKISRIYIPKFSSSDLQMRIAILHLHSCQLQKIWAAFLPPIISLRIYILLVNLPRPSLRLLCSKASEVS
jgi:DNA-binding transcriptional LysR family regulator